MSGLVQFLLALVIVTLTFLVVLVGVQFFRVLHELKQALVKLNRIMDHTQQLSDSAVKPLAAVNQFFSEVKDLVGQTQDEIISQTPDRVVASSKSLKRRLFHRAGQFLRPISS